MLINNRHGENVFQIKYKMEYKTFLWLPLISKHCLLFFALCFWELCCF